MGQNNIAQSNGEALVKRQGPVLKVTSSYPIHGARLITPSAKKQPQAEKPVGLGRDMVERLLQHELTRAESEWKKQLDEACRKAYEEGFANGRKETEDKLVGQFQKSAQILKKTTERFHAETRTLAQEQEQQMLRLILTIARKVVGVEAAMNPDLVLDVLRNAFRLTNEKSVTRIVVNTGDLEHLRGQFEQLRTQFDLTDGVKLIGSDALEPGGVRVESEYSSVDADIATQFDEISRHMLKDDNPSDE